MNFASNRAAVPARDRLPLHERLDALIAGATRLSRGKAWGLTLLIVAAAAFADLVTGPNIWLGPVYLLIICLPAWTLGMGPGVAVGFACLGLGMLINGAAVYPLGEVAIAWNVAMRILPIATIVTLVGSMRRSYDREWRRARHDALTGVLNRQAFHEKCAAMHDSAAWNILAYVDLDGFKQINDRHGHAAGDETLRAFASNVTGMIRENDIVARIGGDEFLLSLAVGSETEGYRLARQLHDRMNAILDRMPYPIRCSMGVLVLNPRPASFCDTDVQLADQLMYQAKREGAALRAVTMTALCNHEGVIAFSDEVEDRPEDRLASVGAI